LTPFHLPWLCLSPTSACWPLRHVGSRLRWPSRASSLLLPTRLRGQASG